MRPRVGGGKLHETAYAYDHQDRPIRELYADGTSRRFTWNRVDTLEVEVDARGLAKSYTYDAAERRSGCAITGLPPGQGQTSFQAWDYDGLGRRTVGEDNDSRVESAYDSMSRLVLETQRIETGTPHAGAGQSFAGGVSKQVKRAHDGVGNLIKQTYPSGVSFERRYDEIDRLETLEDGFDTAADEDDMIGKFVHAGMGSRRMTRDYWAGGGSAAMRQAFEFDADRRVISLENYIVSGSTRIRGFGYAWDRANNRRYERRLSGSIGDELTGTGDAYRYDSVYRLVHDDQDVGDSSLDGITANAVTAPAMPYVANLASDYVLDAAGNRRQTTIQGTTKTYSLDASGQTGDLAMNQYSAIGTAQRQHDLMGNLTASSDTGRQAFFDADNRLVQWTEGSKDVRYRYDVDGRRTMKEDVRSSSFNRTLFFYDGWQEIEETDGSGNWVKRYIYGEGIDEVLRAELPDAADIDNDGSTIDTATLYYHHNSLASVVAVTNAAGVVKESYRYSAYGTPRIFDKNGNEVSTTQVKQPFMFTGRRWDFEEGSNLYYLRLRFYDPAAGRFVSRDPLGLWGDAAQLGNGQSYCGQNPVNFVDPLGLNTWSVGPLDENGNVTTYDAETARRIRMDSARQQAREREAREGSGLSFGDVLGMLLEELAGAIAEEFIPLDVLLSLFYIATSDNPCQDAAIEAFALIPGVDVAKHFGRFWRRLDDLRAARRGGTRTRAGPPGNTPGRAGGQGGGTNGSSSSGAGGPAAGGSGGGQDGAIPPIGGSDDDLPYTTGTKSDEPLVRGQGHETGQVPAEQEGLPPEWGTVTKETTYTPDRQLGDVIEGGETTTTNTRTQMRGGLRGGQNPGGAPPSIGTFSPSSGGYISSP
jgi:RHS repeat-associated protein